NKVCSKDYKGLVSGNLTSDNYLAPLHNSRRMFVGGGNACQISRQLVVLPFSGSRASGRAVRKRESFVMSFTRILAGFVVAGLLVAASLLFTAVPALASSSSRFVGDTGVPLDAPYVPTPQPVVDAMLRIANVGAKDIVYDLGSGDGRLVVSAVRDFGASKGVGVDIDPVRIK